MIATLGLVLVIFGSRPHPAARTRSPTPSAATSRPRTGSPAPPSSPTRPSPSPATFSNTFAGIAPARCRCSSPSSSSAALVGYVLIRGPLPGRERAATESPAEPTTSRLPRPPAPSAAMTTTIDADAVADIDALLEITDRLADAVPRHLQPGDRRALRARVLSWPAPQPPRLEPLPARPHRALRRRPAHRPGPGPAAAVPNRSPRCCSSASTTPAAPRWPPRCSSTTPPAGSTSAPPAPARRRDQPRRHRGDGRDRHRPRPTSTPNRSPTSASAPPTSSSPWAAATPARSPRQALPRLGPPATPPARTSTRSAAIRDEIDAARHRTARSPACRNRIRPPDARKGHPMCPTKPTVLFVCVHNAGRSQMAAGCLTPPRRRPRRRPLRRLRARRPDQPRRRARP